MSDGSSDGLRQMERTRRALEARIEELEEERDRIAGAFERDHHEQCSKRRAVERERDGAQAALRVAMAELRQVCDILGGPQSAKSAIDLARMARTALDIDSVIMEHDDVVRDRMAALNRRWRRRALAMHLQARRLRAGEEAALHCQAVEFRRYLRWRRRALALLEQVRRQRAYTGRVLRAMLAIHRDRQQQNQARNAWAERAMELALKVDADTDKE